MGDDPFDWKPLSAPYPEITLWGTRIEEGGSFLLSYNSEWEAWLSSYKKDNNSETEYLNGKNAKGIPNDFPTRQAAVDACIIKLRSIRQ